MAEYLTLGEIIEAQFYPIVRHIKNFFGFGLENGRSNRASTSTQRSPGRSPARHRISTGACSGSFDDQLSPTRITRSQRLGAASPFEETRSASLDVPHREFARSRTCSIDNSMEPYSVFDCNKTFLEVPEFEGGSSDEHLGRLQFSVVYDFDTSTLTVRIIKAEELAAKDLSGTSDPYVKIALLPEKKHSLATNVKKKNLNPRWNESFAFEGFPYAKVVSKSLFMVVMDYDRFSRDDPIGEVCIPLSDLDLANDQPMWRTLQPSKEGSGKLGVLLLSLSYQPVVGVITVNIMKAKDLKAKDLNGLSDPYVKIWLTHDGKKVEKKKTEVKEKNLNPIFDETFFFTVPYEKIRQTSLVVTVMDYDRFGRNEAIGQIVLGNKSGPMEVKHWNEMFAKSRHSVPQWHLLKDFG